MENNKSLLEFLEHKSSLMALSYRMLGSISEAEEIVQDVYVKWLEAGGIDKIRSPRSWLFAVCSNAAIDQLGKAYKARESYPGVWLPEPVLNKVEPWQESGIELQESLSTAFLLILESLKPIERAVFLLHDIFGYSHKEIAQMVDRSDNHCRKIAERARRHIKENRPLFDSPSKQDLQSLENFFQAIKEGDLNKVAELFSYDPEFWSDGGGKVIAVPKVLKDAMQISKFFIGVLSRRLTEQKGFQTELTKINNRHGLIVSSKENDVWRIETIFSFEITEGKIARIFAIRNPDKFTLFS